jgi:hypothetical protein
MVGERTQEARKCEELVIQDPVSGTRVTQVKLVRSKSSHKSSKSQVRAYGPLTRVIQVASQDPYAVDSSQPSRKSET